LNEPCYYVIHGTHREKERLHFLLHFLPEELREDYIKENINFVPIDIILDVIGNNKKNILFLLASYLKKKDEISYLLELLFQIEDLIEEEISNLIRNKLSYIKKKDSVLKLFDSKFTETPFGIEILKRKHLLTTYDLNIIQEYH